jgi:hypothetical protein
MKAATVLLAVALAGVAGGVRAMSFHAQPPFLYLAGRVVPTDWEAWNEAMKRFDGKIRAVVFDNSPGGNSKTGRMIGASIREHGFMTVVAGRCSSACANMFLGGKQRLFSAKLLERPTVLGYHGTYEHRNNHHLVKNRPPDYFLDMTDGKMSEELVARFTSIEKRQGLLYFIHPNQQAKDGESLAYFCNGDENPQYRDEECERLKDVDALSAGVVTSWDLANVPEPPKPNRTNATATSWD